MSESSIVKSLRELHLVSNYLLDGKEGFSLTSFYNVGKTPSPDYLDEVQSKSLIKKSDFIISNIISLKLKGDIVTGSYKSSSNSRYYLF